MVFSPFCSSYILRLTICLQNKPIFILISIPILSLLLQTEMDLETGAPKDELAPETLSWFKTLGVEYKKLSEVIAAGPCPKVSYRLILKHNIRRMKIRLILVLYRYPCFDSPFSIPNLPFFHSILGVCSN